MSADKAAATSWLRDVAARRWDAALADRGGFTRAASSVVYSRKVADGGRQRIHLDVLVRPPYARTAFHLLLRVTVAFPAMAEVGARMLGNLAGGLTEANLREWIESGVEPGEVGRLAVIVAAGQLATGDEELARRTLETAYPPGSSSRDSYAAAFAVVEAS